MPTPRYLTSLRSDQMVALSSLTTEPELGMQSITLEEIERIEGDRYGFRGFLVPARAFSSYAIGDQVYVQWQDGRPLVILSISRPRGNAVDDPEDLAVPRIEALLLLKVAGVWDVWFRDDRFFVPLELSQYVNHDNASRNLNGGETPPFVVRWGQGPDTFVVMTAVPFPGTTADLITGWAPKLYIFRINRKDDSPPHQPSPTAKIVKTLSPPLVPSGYVLVTDSPFAPAHTYATPAPSVFDQAWPPAPYPGGGTLNGSSGGIGDLLLTKELDVLLLLTVQSSVSSTLTVTGPPSELASADQEREVVLVWSATQNAAVASFSSLNGQFVGSPNPIGGVDTSTNTFRTIVTQLAFVSWDREHVEKQIIFCAIADTRMSLIAPLPPGVARWQGYNARHYWLVNGAGIIRQVIPDQAFTLNQVKDSSLNPTPFMNRRYGIGTECILPFVDPFSTGPPLPPFVGVGELPGYGSLADRGYIVARRMGVIQVGTDNPPDFVFAFGTEELGIIRVSDGIFFPTSPARTLVQIVDGDQVTTEGSEAITQLFFRWVDLTHLYAVPEGESAAVPHAPLRAQRDRVVKLLDTRATPPVPSVVFFPLGELTADPTIKTEHLLKWLVTLPPTETTENSATEALLAISIPRTSYRMVAG